MVFNCKPYRIIDSLLRLFFLGLLISTLLTLTACEETETDTESTLTNTIAIDPTDNVDITLALDTTADDDFEATDWTDDTHSKSADANFAEVFDDTAVKNLHIVVTEARWQSMLDNMTTLYGEFGQTAKGDLPPPMPGSQPPTITTADASLIDSTTEDPIFVPAEILYNGTQWYKVGIRFKGNSSLKSSWEQGILKLSFKLDFDEYEDDYPQIKNQRFYGFKKLSLKNNYQDQSLLREKVAADVFTSAGLPVSHTAFYNLYVHYGDESINFGLYTMVEEIDDTVIDTQFDSNKGNLYKPENEGASFVDSTLIETDFEKKTNEDEADWSDIKALFTALHADSSDAEAWRENLEAVFDVDHFLHYLAVNEIIQNWDTYGRMTHNFYLYNDPNTSKLTWIPWDHNEALQEGGMGGALALDFSNLEGDDWPLISKIMADSTYKTIYDNYLSTVISGAFESNKMTSLYEKYTALIKPYALAEVENTEQGYTFLNDISDFDSAIETLKTHVEDRKIAVDDYLSQQ
ncbi:CotH kinase family protein [Psychromonas antarctica]|uniref:CotH kinase family protein n=1 Tax=Psychromonas antarctica TaxID=67573 RepID=UPI001EE98E1B|nr:CotH kinase family protein [Psychromonas antarctica]MCG6201794.1 CotH kinase family protein [Psychromonas antarctica]